MLSSTDKQLLAKLRSNEYPNVAEDDKGFFVVWADGRGIVGYRNKDHAIKFIEQGDRDACSVTYREKREEEKVTIRNEFSLDKSAGIHDLLFKEAKTKRDHRIRTAQNEILFTEASERIEEKPAKPMARQSGGSTLRNSGWNTNWDFVDPTPSIENVKKEVQQKAAQFFAGIQGQGASQQSAADLRPSKPLDFIFKYIRTIIPEKDEGAQQKTLNALQLLDQILPKNQHGQGFLQFQKEIERLNIPLNPYFMVSMFSKQNGGVAPDQLQEFMGEEQGRALSMPRRQGEAHGQQVPTQSHYREHMQRGNARLTEYPNTFRIFSMSELDKMSSEWIIQAIDDRIDSGYMLSLKLLERYINELGTKKIQQDPQDAELYANNYTALFNDIEAWWKNREENDLTWYALTVLIQNMQYMGGGVPDVAPDELRVKLASTPYFCNGWDSSANDPNVNMLTIPPLRQLPRGEVVYDRGNGNMGYDHLVLNWKGGLESILKAWGPVVDQWMAMLQKGDPSIEQRSPEVAAALQNIMSLDTGNRTGSEALLDLLAKYPTWEQFRENHIEKSLSSEIRSVNNYLKTGAAITQFNAQDKNILHQQITARGRQIYQTAQTDTVAASRELKATSAELCQVYRQGKLMNWDELTAALSYLNKVSKFAPGVESNGISGPKPTQRRSMIDKPGFELLKQYGYQVGKIMDFLFAVITRCCHEKINTRWNKAEENFFGHQYSTSSGTSQGGDVILEVNFARLDATMGDKLVEVTENLTFTIGQRTGGGHGDIILRDRTSWTQLANDFREIQPHAWHEASIINEPINKRLEILEIAIKEALNEVRNNVQVRYTDSDGISTILSGEELASDKMQVGEDAGTDIAEDAPNEQAPANQPADPFSYNWTGEEIPADYVPPQEEQQIPAQPSMTPTTPKEEQMMKPLEEEPMNFLQKRKNDKRRLFRERTRNVPSEVTSVLGSVEERLIKAANSLDEHGEEQTANKIDFLLQKLCEVDNVRQTSRLQTN